MKLRPLLRQRWRPLLGLALVVLGAGWLLYSPPVDTPEAPAPRVAAPPQPATPPPAPASPAENAPQPAAVPESPDIFAVRTWEVPPPAETVAEQTAAPDAPPPPPPPPEAPPLPFRFLGKVEEPGKPTVVFLAREDVVLAVHPGDVIDKQYQVGRLEKDELHFLYRPLKIRQTLSMGGDT